MKTSFRPEFINRLDEIIIFDILSPEAIREIVDLRIQVVKDRLETKDIDFNISEEALTYLAQEGYNPHYGARPLNRLIQTKILNPVATHIIENGTKKGYAVFVTMKNNELVIETKKGHAIGRARKIKSPINIETTRA